MQHSRWRAAVLLLLVAALTLGAAACSAAQDPGEAEVAGDAVKLEPVEGTELSKVILSQRAAERLGIQTDHVRLARLARTRNGGGPATTRKVIAHAAVLYDESGDTWTFTSPQPLTFLRQPIDIDYIDGGSVVLRDGPPAGTTVVTVGAAELLGAELGVGE
jgi:hypothetical protein